MSIEFFCEHCYQKVETPDSTAGKKGRCPHCGEIMRIPTSSSAGPAAPAQGAPQIPELPEMHSQNPYSKPISPDSKSQTATGPATPQNSWGQSGPTAHHGRDAARSNAREILAGPVAMLNVFSILNIVLSLFGAVLTLILFGRSYSLGEPIYLHLAISMVSTAINVTFSTLICIGANHAKLTKSYTMAIAGCVLAILPLTGCCLITAPLGIWTMTILFRADVKQAFRRF